MNHKLLLTIIAIIWITLVPVFSFAQEEDELFYLENERQLMDAGKYSEAQAIFEKYFEKYKSENNTRNMAKYKKVLADTYIKQGNYDKALTLYKEAEVLITKINDKKLERSVFNNIGLCYSNIGESKLAEQYYQKALDISKEINYSYGIISGYNNTGNLYFNLGNYKKAVENFEKAYEQAKLSEKEEYQISVLMNLSNILNFTGQFGKAKENYLIIIEKAKKYNDQSLYADTLHNLAILENNLSNYENAIKYYEDSLNIYKTLNNNDKIATLYMNLAATKYLLASQKGIEEKNKLFLESIELIKEARTQAISLNKLDTAMYAHKKLLDIRQSMLYACKEIAKKNDEITKNLEELSNLLKSQGKKDLTADIQMLNQSATMCKNVNIDNELTEDLKSIEQLKKAAIESNYSSLLADIYSLEANRYYLAGDLEKSIECLNKTIEIKNNMLEDYSAYDIWNTFYKLAKIYEEIGKKENALYNYQLAFENLNDISNSITSEKDKNNYINSKQNFYKDFASLKAKSGDLEGAKAIIDFAKLSEMSDYINIGLNNTSKTNDKTELAQKAFNEKTHSTTVSKQIETEISKPSEQQDQEKLLALREKLKQARIDFQQTALKIQQEYPEILKYIAIKPTNFNTIKSKLPKTDVIIEPIILEDRVLIFVGHSGKKPSVYKQVDITDKEVLSLLIDFRKGIKNKDKEGLITASKSLYNVFIRPIESEINGYKTLIISPYENLRYIPFQALNNGDKFLIEDYNIVNITSSSALNLGSQKKLDLSSLKLLAFGNPTEDLPSAESEVRNIAKSIPDNKIYLGPNALKNAFENEIYNNYNIIHLATHGVLNNIYPENSKLLFAGKDNNFITVSEIMGYDFSDTDLIVLSACDSNIGKAKGAEISALGSSFELAAAPSIIASLWKIDDKSTSMIMEEFYKNISNGQTKAEALKMAQLKALKANYSGNPYYWAAFIIMGEWL